MQGERKYKYRGANGRHQEGRTTLARVMTSIVNYNVIWQQQKKLTASIQREKAGLQKLPSLYVGRGSQEVPGRNKII